MIPKPKIGKSLFKILTGVVIGSTTGDGGTTNYTVPGIVYISSVNLSAPAMDPSGYAFSCWTINGANQNPGLTNLTFTMPMQATTAVATAIMRIVHFLETGVERSTHLPHIHAQKLKMIP